MSDAAPSRGRATETIVRWSTARTWGVGMSAKGDLKGDESVVVRRVFWGTYPDGGLRKVEAPCLKHGLESPGDNCSLATGGKGPSRCSSRRRLEDRLLKRGPKGPEAPGLKDAWGRFTWEEFHA